MEQVTKLSSKNLAQRHTTIQSRAKPQDSAQNSCPVATSSLGAGEPLKMVGGLGRISLPLRLGRALPPKHWYTCRIPGECPAAQVLCL
jgi:hypothetical protein